MKDKPDLALLIGKPVKDKPMSDEDHGMSDDMQDEGEGGEKDAMQHSAVSAIMKAFAMKDVAGATQALKDFLDMADDDGMPMPEHSEDE